MTTQTAGEFSQLRYEVGRSASRFWWVPLVTGVLWLIFALIVFRFDARSVSAVGTLVGIVFIAAGVEDFMNLGLHRGVWAWLYGILGGSLMVGGLIALIYPDRTFLILASIVGWLLLLDGIFNLVLGLSNRDVELWWMRVVMGVLEIALAVTVSGNIVEGAIFVLLFIGATATVRGVLQIVLAFQIRSAGRALQGGA